MRKLMKKFEDLMVAITFAEAGEYETASRMLGTGATGDKEETLPPTHEPEPAPRHGGYAGRLR